jgi:hypothetical protein
MPTLCSAMSFAHARIDVSGPQVNTSGFITS